MAIIKKFAPFQNLTNFQVFLNDSGNNSDYFRITEFKDTLTGGKNGFLIEGSEFLKESTEVKIELLDVEGNPIYFEPGDGIPEYYEGTSKLISVHVYDDTPIGLGKITILGELKNYVDEFGATVPVPSEWRGVYNVKWERTFQVNKNIANETIVRFYKRPQVQITELIKPIFSKSIPSVTDTGYVHGIAQVPAEATDIRNWRAGTTYKLQRTSGSWDRDVDDNTITISSPTHTANIVEVLNDTEVLINVPYTINNLVSNFTSGSYSVTYSNFTNQIISDTVLTGSFAKIDITQLKTFVGDVARVKVFRKSRNAVGDFQFVQESKLESTELLRDITTSQDTELSYGRFDEYNLSTYWETSSVQHPVTVDSSVLSQALKFDYNTSAGGVQQLITSQSFDISNDVEYTLNFKTILSGSLSDSGKSIKAFFSSSNFTQDFVTVSGSAVYRTRQNVSQNILSQNSGSAKLVFEVTGDDWYISNVSLKNAQDTSFSPDEFTLIQDIPRKTASETFDFRFEFYDINNNYIPVDVTAVGVFDGGNDFPTSGKLLTLEADRNAFRFSSGSVANPYNQTIQFKTTAQNLTGSILFESSAFDVDGNYLSPSDYTQYPGKLTNVTTAGALVTLSNFTGSRVDGLLTPFVGSVVYTASLENLQEFETVYRLEDGDNAPQLIVTSNANQFIYEPTKLNPKPSGQVITVRAQRKNLASLVTPIEVNSGSNLPELTYVSTTSGIDTYTISATAFSQSFAANNFDEVTYSFTGSDVFGNSQSDEITLSKVINFDGVSIVLSNESTSFPAKSTGEVIGNFNSSSGSVQMFIGSSQIVHDDYDSDSSRNRNTFDIKTITATNVTATDTSPNTNNYSISAFETNKDSGSLTLDIEYLAGDNSTSQSFQKVVSYTKAKKAVPTALTKTSPSTQTINSSSVGFEVPQDVEVIVQEGGTEYTYQSGLSGGDSEAYKFEIISISSGSQHPTIDNLIIPDYGSGSNYNGTIGSASISYVNSEGTFIENKTVRFDVSVSKVGVDGRSARAVKLSFSDNSITYNADGTNPSPSSITLIASASNFDDPIFKFTGGDSYFTDETSFTAGATQNTDTASVTVPTTYQTSPLSFEVEVQESANSLIRASDRESLIFVKPGLDIRPRFIIKPLNGTQIKNAQGSLELQVVRIDGSGSFDISGSAQGDAQIYSGSNILTAAMTGINPSTNGITYNPVISPSAISGSKELLLKDSDGTVLDSITLLDVTDGQSGGSFITDSGLLLRREVGNTYAPTELNVTASFFGTYGLEYQKAVTITPNWNGTVDQMKVSTATGDSSVTITANDGDGNSITLGDTSYTNTKDVVLVASFKDPVYASSPTISVSESFFIVSDGRDGTAARIVRLGADSQIFTVSNSGVVSPTTITLTANTQNISGSLTFNATNGVSLTGSGNTRTIGNAEFALDSITDSVISVTGSEDGVEYTDEITIVKLNEGTDAITVINTNQSHTLPASSSGEVLDYQNSGTTIKVFEGVTELSYDNDGTLGSDWDISTSVSPSNVITVGSLTDNGDNVTFGNHSNMHIDSGSAVITYSITGSRRDGREFTAETTQTITKAKEGLDALTLTNTNTNHTFVANPSGVVSSYSGGDTDIQVLEGGTELTFTTGTPTNGQFGVSIGNTSGITEGTASGNGTTTLTISEPSNMTVSNAVITYTISGKRIGGDSFTLITTQTFSKAQEGAVGVDAQLVKLSSNKYAIKYDGDGNLAPSGQTFILSGSSQGFSTPEYRFLENGSQIQSFSTTDSFTVPTDGGALPSVGTSNLYQVQVREQGGTYESIFDNIDVFAVQSGSDSYTTFLTNEAHVFSANSIGDLLSPLADGAFEARFFRGGTQYTYDQTSPYGDNTYRTGSVTLNNITTGSSVVSNQLKITPASLTDDSGSIIIDLIDNATGTTFENTYTFAKSKSGASPVNISISPQAQTITSASGVYGTPQAVFITVTEGGDLYTYDSVSPYGDSTFRITGVDGGTDVSTQGATSGSITPPSVTTDDGYSKTITLAYVNSEGTTFSNKTINYNVGVAKQGTNGAAGTDAKSIKLTASQYTVLYDGDGNKTAVAIVLTGTAQNFSSPQYRFLENGTERQAWSTTNTYTIPDSQEAAANSTDNWKVEVREGSSGTYDAFDSIDIVGVQDGTDGDPGEDAYTVILTNESHTLPTTNTGTVTYTGSGTQIIVYKGTTELNGITSGTPTTGQFKVTATGTDITPNASPTSTGNPVVYGVHSNMTQDNASISYSINVENSSTFTKLQSFSKSIEGDDGEEGASVNIIFKRSASNPGQPSASAGVPSGWSDTPPSGTDILWASQGTKGVGATTFTWGTPYQVEGTATAEIAIYRLNNNTAPSNGSYNFTTSTLTVPSGWSKSVPSISSNGDVVYQSVGLFVGSPEATAATASWSTPVIYAQRTDGDPGDPGPGITYVGECADLASGYTWTSDSSTRQVTSVSGTYYLTKDAADGVAKSTTGCPPNTTYFEAMTSFASVATDVLFAQDVYANKTVNVGTSPTGTEPVIALNADAANSYANPYIGLNATSYDSNGIFLGYTGGTAVFSIKSATNSLTWDGSDLTINGEVNADSGDIAGFVLNDNQLRATYIGQGGSSTFMVLDSSQGANFSYDGDDAGGISFGPQTGPALSTAIDNVWHYAPGSDNTYFRVGDSNRFIEFDGANSTIAIATQNFSVTTAGAITATSGDIGGWDINSNYLQQNGVTLVATATTNPNTSNSINPGLSIDDGSKERVIITATDGFQTSATTGAAGSSITGDTSSTDTLTGPIYNNNTLSEATDATYTATKTYSMTVGQSISITSSNLGAFTAQSAGTRWIERSNASDFFLSYHFITFKCQFKNSGGTVISTKEQTIVQGSVHHYSGNYHKNLTTTEASFIAPNNTASVLVTLTHHVGMDYLSSGFSVTAKASIPTITPNLGDAPQTVEICRQGIQAFAADNYFKIDTDGGSATFLDVKGSTAIDGNMTVTAIEAESATITSLQITDLSFAGDQLTIDGDLRVTGDIYAQATSDKKLKNNLSIISNPINKIIKLNGYEFDWVENPEVHGLVGHDIGVIAQEVEEIIPSAVKTKKGGYLGVEYHKIIPLLVEGIKEQQNQIEELKKEIKKLKEK